MVNQIAPFPLVVPVGTTPAAPAVFNTDLGNYDVVGVTVVVPRGCNGNVGFRFTSGGLAMIPAHASDWIVASDEVIDWPLSGVLDSGAWQVTAYNLGIYPHTLYVRYQLTVPNQSLTGLAAPTLLSAAAIQGATDLAATSVPDVTM